MADGSTRPIGVMPVGSRVRRLAPGLLTAGIGAVFTAGVVTSLTGFGAAGTVQQVGAASDVELVSSSGQPGALTAGAGLYAGDIVTTGARGSATLDAGTSRLYVGPASSVLVDSATHWTVRTGQVGLSRGPIVTGPAPVVTAGAFTVVAGPVSGVRIDRAGAVQAAVLRGSAQVHAGTASLNLGTLRQLSLPGTTLTVPQLVQTLDDSADGVDVKLAPQLVALDSALTRLATQVGADPLAARLFGHDGLPPSEAALEWAILHVGNLPGGNGIQLDAAGPDGHVAWGILAASAGADDTQVRTYVGTILDGTEAPPVGPPDGSSAGPPSSQPVPVSASTPPAETSPAGPTTDDDGGPTAAPPSRDTGDNGSSAAPTTTPAVPTTPPAESASPVDSTPPPDQSSPPAPTTAPPTSDEVPTDQPSSDAPTTDPAGQQQQNTSGGAEPQTAPDAAAAAGPFGLLAVLARGVGGPATKPAPSPAAPATKVPAPSPSPVRSPSPSTHMTLKALAAKASAVPSSAPKSNRSVKSKTPSARVSLSAKGNHPASVTPSPSTRPAGGSAVAGVVASPTPKPTTAPPRPPVNAGLGAVLCPILGPGGFCSVPHDRGPGPQLR